MGTYVNFDSAAQDNDVGIVSEFTALSKIEQYCLALMALLYAVWNIAGIAVVIRKCKKKEVPSGRDEVYPVIDYWIQFQHQNYLAMI